MPVKLVEVAELGQIALYKRKGVSGVRMSIRHDGSIRITLPAWAPYRLGIEFARNKAEWIASQRKPVRQIMPGDRVGKAHRFVFINKTGQHQPSTRIVGTDIRITLEIDADIASQPVQDAAHKAAVRALKKEAEQLLPQRLQTLAQQHGFAYNSVAIKRLRSRWGSCNERQDIVLNCFLMQLPWYLIDYVLLHELVHTRILRHGEPFWSELSSYVKDLKTIRKEIKTHQPSLLVVEGPFVEENSGLSKAVTVDSL